MIGAKMGEYDNYIRQLIRTRQLCDMPVKWLRKLTEVPARARREQWSRGQCVKVIIQTEFPYEPNKR